MSGARVSTSHIASLVLGRNQLMMVVTSASLGMSAARGCPGCHESLHDGTIPDFVLDGVGVIRACFFEEVFEVVCGRSCPELAAAHGLYDMLCAIAACWLIDATIVFGCGLLASLSYPLLAGLGTLPGTLDGNTFPLLLGVG
jgi:hypothetical protein